MTNDKTLSGTAWSRSDSRSAGLESCTTAATNALVWNAEKWGDGEVWRVKFPMEVVGYVLFAFGIDSLGRLRVAFADRSAHEALTVNFYV